MDMRMVDAGGVRLACRVSGAAAGSTVVLLHALGRNGTDWNPVAWELGERRRVFAPDLRGHGDSDRPGSYSPELMREDLDALLTACRLERVTLVGHGLGGVVAYLYAAGHPERVERLVLEDVPAPWPREAGPPGPGTPGPGTTDGTEAVGPEVVGPLRARLADPPKEWLAALEAVTAPTLLLCGGLRGDVPRDDVAAMARRIADVRLVTIPCGRGIHTGRPQDYLAAVDGFLPAGGFG